MQRLLHQQLMQRTHLMLQLLETSAMQDLWTRRGGLIALWQQKRKQKKMGVADAGCQLALTAAGAELHQSKQKNAGAELQRVQAAAAARLQRRMRAAAALPEKLQMMRASPVQQTTEGQRAAQHQPLGLLLAALNALHLLLPHLHQMISMTTEARQTAGAEEAPGIRSPKASCMCKARAMTLAEALQVVQLIDIMHWTVAEQANT